MGRTARPAAGSRGRAKGAPERNSGGPGAGAGADRDPEGDPLAARRRRIDAIDRQLVGLLNERATHAIALGGLKKERGLPIYQPSREEEVLQNVQEFNQGPLEGPALRRLFERIIDESRRIERIATTRASEAAVKERPGSGSDPGKD